jgi:hypothetical protein
MPLKKIFDVDQREVIVFIYASYLTRESTLYSLNVSKYLKRKDLVTEITTIENSRQIVDALCAIGDEEDK